NSSVNDSCELCGPSDFQVEWALKWKRYMNMTVYKAGDYEGYGFPVTVNSSYLGSLGIDISDWHVNYTRVLLNGAEVSSRVNTWNNSNKTVMNWSQEYFGANSELVFLANQSDWENLTYEITYNTSGSQEDFGFLENSGFESGLLGPWSCYGSNTSTGELSLEVCDGPYCTCEIRQSGGNYSLFLSSDDKGGSFSSIQGVRIYSGHPLGYDRIRVRYNFTGEFDNTTGDAYLRIYAGNGSCDLDITDSLRNTWQEQVCYNTSFSAATWVNITVHDYGFGGGGLVDASHAYIDSICLADSNGSCVSYHSGHRHNMSSLSQDILDTGKDITWNIPVTEHLGIRKLMANASGNNYVGDEKYHYLYVYGWSG
ncbi:MAG: hypothetical protein KAT35_05885, partial [Candidatus Aenigmarchaeota archaeon]|nr:hypothetical protein [Candidatus Aenigmarchaeota archaeon]